MKQALFLWFSFIMLLMGHSFAIAGPNLQEQQILEALYFAMDGEYELAAEQLHRACPNGIEAENLNLSTSNSLNYLFGAFYREGFPQYAHLATEVLLKSELNSLSHFNLLSYYFYSIEHEATRAQINRVLQNKFPHYPPAINQFTDNESLNKFKRNAGDTVELLLSRAKQHLANKEKISQLESLQDYYEDLARFYREQSVYRRAVNFCRSLLKR